MRISLPCFLFLVFINASDLFAQVGFEQYCYLGDEKMLEFVPIINYQAGSHGYLEARYNYEEVNTFSLYGGRVFAGGNNLAYTVTPMLGGVIGKFNGASANVNVTLEYKKIFFSSQSQYTRSFQEVSSDFLYAWSDLGYQPYEWIFVGLSAQQTYLPRLRSLFLESGMLVGVTIENWTFPLYWFTPVSDRQYFVLGVNYNIGASLRNK